MTIMKKKKKEMMMMMIMMSLKALMAMMVTHTCDGCNRSNIHFKCGPYTVKHKAPTAVAKYNYGIFVIGFHLLSFLWHDAVTYNKTTALSLLSGDQDTVYVNGSPSEGPCSG